MNGDEDNGEHVEPPDHESENAERAPWWTTYPDLAADPVDTIYDPHDTVHVRHPAQQPPAP